MAPKHIKGSCEIYKAVAADAAACGMTPKQFAERFIEEALRELRKLNWISRRAARQRSLPAARVRSGGVSGPTIFTLFVPPQAVNSWHVPRDGLLHSL